MKKLQLLLVTGVILLSGCANKQTTKIYPYPFDSAKITFTLEGTAKGTSVFYMKGDKSVRETHVVTKGDQGEEKKDEMFIDMGETIYQIDLNKKTGLSTKNPIYEALKKLTPDKRMDFLKRLAVGVDPEDTTQNPQVLREETVAGQKCQVYAVQGVGEICLWNNIILKVNINVPEQNVNSQIVATSLDLNLEVPDSQFNVPTGIEVKDLDAQPAATPTIDGVATPPATPSTK